MSEQSRAESAEVMLLMQATGAAGCGSPNRG